MSQSKSPQKQDQLSLDIETIPVDDLRLLYNLGVPIVCNINPNNKLFVSLQIKAFMMRLDRAGLISVDYWSSTVNQIPFTYRAASTGIKFICEGSVLQHSITESGVSTRKPTVDIKKIIREISDGVFEHPSKFRSGSNTYFKENK